MPASTTACSPSPRRAEGAGPVRERAAAWLRLRWAASGLARRRGDTPAALARAYLADPVATARLDARSAAKLDHAFARIETDHGETRAEATERILDLAKARVEARLPTLYLNNPGSSGSHWVMGMLRAGTGLLGQGEIYVPLPYLVGRVEPLALPERALFLQAVGLAHLLTGTPSDGTVPLANSAHLPDLGAYARSEVAPRRVLLVRDPVEIVLSRTLRKPRFRRLLGREDAPDGRYLAENIRHVRRFHDRAAREDYDLVVRYEDLRRDPVPGLAAIAGLLGLAADPDRLAAAAAAARLSHRRETAAARPHPDLRRTAEEALAPLRRRLGYL